MWQILGHRNRLETETSGRFSASKSSFHNSGGPGFEGKLSDVGHIEMLRHDDEGQLGTSQVWCRESEEKKLGIGFRLFWTVTVRHSGDLRFLKLGEAESGMEQASAVPRRTWLVPRKNALLTRAIKKSR